MRRMNMGPPWRRHSGVLVPHGGVFETTSREESIIAMPQYGLQAVLVPFDGGAPPPAVAVVSAPAQPSPNLVAAIADKVKAAEAAAKVAEWPLKVSPQAYLERYPDGKHAEQARQLIEAGVPPQTEGEP